MRNERARAWRTTHSTEKGPQPAEYVKYSKKAFFTFTANCDSFQHGFLGLEPARIAGTLHLRYPPDRPIRVRRIEVLLVGYEHVYLFGEGGDSSTRYRGTVLEFRRTVWESRNEQHEMSNRDFAFAFELPDTTPSSLKVEKNEIFYRLQAVITRSPQLFQSPEKCVDTACEVRRYELPPTDAGIRLAHSISRPSVLPLSSLSRSGRFGYDISVPRQTFCPTASIPVCIKLYFHDSQVSVKRIFIGLKQYAELSVKNSRRTLKTYVARSVVLGRDIPMLANAVDESLTTTTLDLIGSAGVLVPEVQTQHIRVSHKLKVKLRLGNASDVNLDTDIRIVHVVPETCFLWSRQVLMSPSPSPSSSSQTPSMPSSVGPAQFRTSANDSSSDDEDEEERALKLALLLSQVCGEDERDELALAYALSLSERKQRRKDFKPEGTIHGEHTAQGSDRDRLLKTDEVVTTEAADEDEQLMLAKALSLSEAEHRKGQQTQAQHMQAERQQQVVRQQRDETSHGSQWLQPLLLLPQSNYANLTSASAHSNPFVAPTFPTLGNHQVLPDSPLPAMLSSNPFATSSLVSSPNVVSLERPNRVDSTSFTLQNPFTTASTSSSQSQYSSGRTILPPPALAFESNNPFIDPPDAFRTDPASIPFGVTSSTTDPPVFYQMPMPASSIPPSDALQTLTDSLPLVTHPGPDPADMEPPPPYSENP